MFYAARMSMDADWDMAIDRNRKPLLRIVASLFAAIGLADGGVIERLPHALYWAVLSILRPAESAVRRLIVVAARNLVEKPSPSPPAPAEPEPSGDSKKKGNSKGTGRTKGKGRIVFRLFDPRKRSEWVDDPDCASRPWPSDDPHRYGEPEAAPFRQSEPRAPAPDRDAAVNATSLCRRLLAIKAALDDLAAQARRYARWRAKPYEQRKPQYPSALRLGPAPASRKKASHEVDNILTECHFLAWSLPKPKPDTS